MKPLVVSMWCAPFIDTQELSVAPCEVLEDGSVIIGSCHIRMEKRHEPFATSSVEAHMLGDSIGQLWGIKA